MRRLTIPALLACALIAGACEDEDGTHFEPGGELNGTWVVQRAGGTTYLRVLPSTVELYVEDDTCFARSRFAIEAIEGVNFSVVPVEGGAPAEWSLERVNDLLVLTIGGQVLTMEPSPVDINRIPVCGGPDPDFPHPGCSNIPQLEVGGAPGASVLGEGDPRWTDDTWYELWAFTLDAPGSVTITYTSDDTDLLDPYLMIYDGLGVERLDENDDIDYDGGNYNSRVGPIDLEAGCYIIVASSWMGDDEGEVGGNYSVVVQ